jgi:hypothetical protein
MSSIGKLCAIAIILATQQLGYMQNSSFFTWEGAMSGNQAVWKPNDTLNIYYFDDISVKVSLIDTFKMNTTTTNMSEFLDCTATNTFFGRGSFAFQIKAEHSATPVCLKMEFSHPIILKNYTVYDIDMKQSSTMPASTYQDSVHFSASLHGQPVKLGLNYMSEQPIFTIDSQSVKAIYVAGQSGDIDFDDERGGVSIYSHSAINSFSLCFSNGSQDDGQSNSQALRIPQFEYQKQLGPLPVQLIGFYGKRISKGIFETKWEVASEKNCDFYTLQTSADGVNFSQSGTIKAMNKENAKYSFSIINNYGSDDIYIKLGQTDFDGKSANLGMLRWQDSGDDKEIVLSPNPTNEFILISNLDNRKGIEYQIFDASGRLVQNGSIPADINPCKINVGDLPSGNYKIAFSPDKSIESQQFIKL